MAKKTMGSHLRHSANEDGKRVTPAEMGVYESSGALVVRLTLQEEGRVHDFPFTTDYLLRPKVVAPLAWAFYWTESSNLWATVKKSFHNYRRFLAFLRGMSSSFGKDVQSLSQIDEGLSELFHQWLKGELRLKGEKTPNLSPIIIAAIYGKMREAFRLLRGEPRFSPDISLTSFTAKNPEPNGAEKVKHYDPLTETDLISLRDACRKDIDETIFTFEQGLSYLQAYPDTVDIYSTTVTPFRNLKICVGAFNKAEKLKLSSTDFARTFPGLRRSLVNPYHSFAKVRRHLHFTSITLVPFILLIALESLFNPDTQLLINLDDVRKPSALSAGRYQAVSKKNRGKAGIQTHTYVGHDTYRYGSNVLYALLIKHTTLTRELVSPSLRHRLFIFANDNCGYSAYHSQNTSSLWGKNLNRFIAKHGLVKFTLSNLRATGSEIISRIFGGDVLPVKRKLHHKSIRTTETSYENQNAKRWRKENTLASEMAIRERRIRSLKKADTRGLNLSRPEKSAVTPGFLCFDPWRSPILGQTVGRMCTAYGRCPSCPLASVDQSSAKAFLRILQVRSRLEEARSVCGQTRWQAVWQPEIEAIDEWMLDFDQSTIDQAKAIYLPPIPEVA